MKPFFNTPERIQKLQFDALVWVGTPWCANSHAKGHGVSCHNLPYEIYVATGFLDETFPRIVGDPAHNKHSCESKMEAFLNTRPEFQRLNLDTETLQPGDLMGIRIFSCVDHLGVCLGANFIHVLMHKKTDVDPVNVPPWSQRTMAAWRPIK